MNYVLRLLISRLSIVSQHRQRQQPSRHLTVQTKHWKHQNNAWNMFKINNKDTRTTSMIISLFVLVFLLLTCRLGFFGKYERIEKSWDSIVSLRSTRTRVNQGVRNVSFSETFAYVLNNGWPLSMSDLGVKYGTAKAADRMHYVHRLFC